VWDNSVPVRIIHSHEQVQPLARSIGSGRVITEKLIIHDKSPNIAPDVKFYLKEQADVKINILMLI
jgi:hypothetical protein